jgi:hypothetical protein
LSISIRYLKLTIKK